MSDVTSLWRRSKMTEMSLIVSISSCLLYSENWGEAIFPIDDSLDVKSSDFDPRCVCRNLITSDSDSAKHECSSDYQEISIGLVSSTGSAVVPPTFCCQTSQTNTALGKCEKSDLFPNSVWGPGWRREWDRQPHCPLPLPLMVSVEFWGKFLWIFPAGRTVCVVADVTEIKIQSVRIWEVSELFKCLRTWIAAM